ncbi:MAG: three-Cys-motif partner protein TcmP [Bacteroidales bacterium]|nr:three-Cys-motif partner protein TcmP [Bacteroidales bacterium]
MAKNINNQPFDETTQLKLDIFRECFREWFPVFIHDKWTDKVFIFDFFAGSGNDTEGKYGSPLVLLDEAKGVDRKFCRNAKKDVAFIFNEVLKKKSEELSSNISNHILTCEKLNNCGRCIYDYKVTQSVFKSIFKEKSTIDILTNKSFGKFILLDQYGFKQIDDEIFHNLIHYPKTDFIFFISSSFIKRFQEHPSVKTYIDTEKLNFDESKPKECHRIIANYFRSSIPLDKEYYLHHFSIQKVKSKGNYYGLIFGSNHTLGMEKFLKVCWQKDKFSGESNFNIDDDFEEGTLFFNSDKSNKKEKVKTLLTNMILEGKIKDNISGLKYTLRLGCEPSLFTNVVKELEKDKKVNRNGVLNYGSVNIHKIKRYFINLTK